MAFDMSNYVDVATRIKLLIEQYPQASIVCTTPKVVDIQGHSFIEVTAHVACNDGSNRNVVASAWEPFPGKTTYTKDSEMMNAETSAVGRAIGMLGIGLSGSMASANEVQNRQVTTQQGDTTVTRPSNAPSDKQVWLLKKLLKEQGKLPPANLASLDKFEVSRMIEALKAGEAPQEDYPTEYPAEEPF